MVTVHVVEELAAVHRAEHGMRAPRRRRSHLGPADVRYRQVHVEAADGAGQEPEPAGAGRFVAPLEAELEAEADAHDRTSGGRSLTHRVTQAAPGEVGRALSEVPDA